MKQNHIVMLGVMELISAGISGCGAFDDGSMDGFSATHASAPANSEDESVIPSPAMPEPESKCHVEPLSNGARIWCDDGTSVSILNGLNGNHGSNGVDGLSGIDGSDGEDGINGASGIDGIDGQDGVAGVNGADGQDGQDAEPCTTTQTEWGATLVCPDGTSAYVLNGTNGGDGVDGLNGTDGIDGLNGVDGADGVDGIDGTSCTSVQTVTGAEIQCSDGTVASIQNGLDGAAGTDGVDGLNGTDGVDGIDGTSCTVLQDASGATISCSDGSTASLLNGVDAATGAPLYSDVLYDPVNNAFTYLRVADLYTCTMSVSTGDTECVAPVIESTEQPLL